MTITISSPLSSRLRHGLRVPAVLAAAALCAGLVACSPEDPPTSPAVSNHTPTAVALPDSDSGALATWTVDQLNGKDGVNTEGLAERMSDTLSAEISSADLADILNNQRENAPWTVTAQKEHAADGLNSIFVQLYSAGTGREFVLQLVRADEQKTLSGLYFLSPSDVDFGSR